MLTLSSSSRRRGGTNQEIPEDHLRDDTTRTLVRGTRPVPTAVEHCPTATSTPDLDFYQVSVAVEPTYFFIQDNNFLELWTSLGGEMLTLSSSSRRRGGTDREIPEDHLILSYHPVMVSTLNRLGLKELIINRLATQGYPSVADDTTRTLVRGTRPVPTAVFRDTLRRCLVTDVTFTNYGMKIPLQQSTSRSAIYPH